MSLSSAFPQFRYHPDPVATGAVIHSNAECLCCGKSRGYVYSMSPYSTRDDLHQRICPWCIHDGTAAARFDASFVQDVEGLRPNSEGQLPPASGYQIEVLTRTPGFNSWQGEFWLCHCDDACEFHGDLSRQDLMSLSPIDEERFLTEHGGGLDLLALKEHYQPGGDVALYKFLCRHCGIIRLGVDLS